MTDFIVYQWSDALFDILKKSMGAEAELLKAQCINGRAQVIQVRDDVQKIDLWSIMRREKKAGFDELVICCIEGKGLRQAAPVIEQWAADNGHETIRFHTRRKGLERLLSGFEVQEVVYNKRLSNG